MTKTFFAWYWGANLFWFCRKAFLNTVATILCPYIARSHIKHFLNSFYISSVRKIVKVQHFIQALIWFLLNQAICQFSLLVAISRIQRQSHAILCEFFFTSYYLHFQTLKVESINCKMANYKNTLFLYLSSLGSQIVETRSGWPRWWQTRHQIACDIWHVTPEMWHLTWDIWHVTNNICHVTHDMWHVTHGGGWTFSKNLSSLAQTVWDIWCLEDLEERNECPPPFFFFFGHQKIGFLLVSVLLSASVMRISVSHMLDFFYTAM